MKVKSMIFNADMVRALLEGRKTQTRRPLKNQPKSVEYWKHGEPTDDTSISCACLRDEFGKGWLNCGIFKSPYSVGDLLYVRETFRCNGWAADVATIFYKASERKSYTEMHELFPVEGKKQLKVSSVWTPSIHMPRWASRLTLKVTGVRVERVQDISEQDAAREGFEGWDDDVTGGCTPFGEFSEVWCGIYGEESWNRNDWVWVIDFEVIHQNVDEYLAGVE